MGLIEEPSSVVLILCDYFPWSPRLCCSPQLWSSFLLVPNRRDLITLVTFWSHPKSSSGKSWTPKSPVMIYHNCDNYCPTRQLLFNKISPSRTDMFWHNCHCLNLTNHLHLFLCVPLARQSRKNNNNLF